MAAAVPSGVRSRGPNPVPPVVTITPANPSASSTKRSRTVSIPSAICRRLDDGPTRLDEPVGQSLAGRVLAGPGDDSVRDGDHLCVQGRPVLRLVVRCLVVRCLSGRCSGFLALGLGGGDLACRYRISILIGWSSHAASLPPENPDSSNQRTRYARGPQPFRPAVPFLLNRSFEFWRTDANPCR